MQYALESFDQQLLSPPERYPLPNAGLHDADSSALPFNYRSLSVEEKKEFLVITRNSVELLSSILNSETEPKPLKVFLVQAHYLNSIRTELNSEPGQG